MGSPDTSTGWAWGSVYGIITPPSFFGAAVLAALLLTAPRSLGRRPIGLAAGIALLVAAPTLGWQVQHGLPFRHQGALLHDGRLVHVV